MDVYPQICFCPFSCTVAKRGHRWRYRWAPRGNSFCLRRIVGVKLRTATGLRLHEQCGTTLLEFMARRLQWMGHVLRMDEDRLPRQVFDCSLARSVAEDDRVEQLKLRPGHRNVKTFLGCTALQSGDAMMKIPVVAPLFRTASTAAEHALDRHAWLDAIENLAPLECKKPQQVGRTTRSCARHGGGG
eukprot:365137-Chlamydomonas_euryale.AAC.7